MKKVIIDVRFELHFPESDEKEHDDSGLIGEIGILPYLESHAEWIKHESFSVGSMIIEDASQMELKV